MVGLGATLLMLAATAITAAPAVALPQARDTIRLPSFLPPSVPFSLGQPPRPRGRWGVLLGYAGDEFAAKGRLYGNLSGRLPILSRLDATAEGALGFEGSYFDAAAGAYVGLPWFKLGAEYDLADGGLPFAMVLEFGLIRGGLLQKGDMVRIDYRPGRKEVMLGASLRLPGQRYRNSRPRKWTVDLPGFTPLGDTLRFAGPADLPASQEARLARIEHSMMWMDRLLTPRFRSGEQFEASATEYRDHVRLPGHSFAGEDSAYHANLDTLFADIAKGRPDLGKLLARAAEGALLNEMVLPFNRLFGQWKSPSNAGPFAPAVETAFRATLDSLPQLAYLLPQHRRLIYGRSATVIRRMARSAELASMAERERWEDRVLLWRRYGELAWLPLNYGLRPEDYDTQEEWDAIHVRLTDRPFTSGNTIKYLMSEQFHVELKRMIRETELYQVTVVHDFRGSEPDGATDIYGWDMVVDGYVEAFVAAIRDLDAGRRGTLPQFFLILDDHYYEANRSRHIMTYLENLWDPGEPAIEDSEIREQVDRAHHRLRATVVASPLLSSLDRDELRNLLRVHVNITNLFDPTSLFDNFMRDHRKFAMRDVFEERPMSGVAMFTGQGIGSHYNGSGWEDRSILVRGESLVQVKEDVRVLLLRQGIEPEEIPFYLRPRPFPEDYQKLCGQLRAEGWTTPVSIAVNETGYGQKLASVGRAATYNLAPAGSRILNFDSLWLSEFWAGMLVNAALRGVYVFPVAPTPLNAPSDADPTMEFLRENLDLMYRAGAYFDEEISSSGGMLKVGLYAREVPVDDTRRRIELFNEGLQRYDFLREVFDLDPVVIERIRVAATEFDEVPLVALRLRANPLLHMKNQLFGTREAFEVFRLGEWSLIVDRYLQVRRDQVNGLATPGLTPSLLRIRSGMTAPSLEDAHRRLLRSYDPERERRVILYWTIGSMNQSFRSIALDGESMVTVSGYNALVAAIDFIFIMAIAEWPETRAEFDQLFPPSSGGIRLPHYELIRSLF